MKFSLILCTVDRDKEVEEFLKSLSTQTYKNFELIVIDQNRDDRVKLIVERYRSLFPIKYFNVDFRGLSKARNYGLRYVEGDIVAFPDDDCKYPPNLLETVKELFEEKKDYEIITGISLDEHTKNPSIGRWIDKNSEIKCTNILQTATSFTIFIKFKREEILFFDEKLGVGSEFGSAEEMDYLFRLLKKGFKGFYYPEKVYVFHPQKGVSFASKKDRERAYYYGLGLGAFFKKHFLKGKNLCLFYPFIRLFLIRPIGGMLLGLLKLDINMFLYYGNVFIGRWNGLIKYDE